MATSGDERLSISGLINFVLTKTSYERWLEEHQGDVHKARWDNVQELITQATDFEDLISYGYEDEALPEVDGLEQNEDAGTLSRFLANVALASEVKTDDTEGAPTAQVTISTIHAAKGLEFDAVFLPGWEEGLFPHQKSLEEKGDLALEEERRLAYVGLTRAKKESFISFVMNRMYRGDWVDSLASRFKHSTFGGTHRLVFHGIHAGDRQSKCQWKYRHKYARRLASTRHSFSCAKRCCCR